MISIKAAVGISGGRQRTNNVDDQNVIMTLLMQANRDPERLVFEAPRPGFCSPFLHQRILKFQRDYSGFGLVADGSVDPNGATLQLLDQLASGLPPTPVRPAPGPLNPPLPSVVPAGRIATSVCKPDELRTEDTWQYLLHFTAVHEYPVYHMYNNRAEGSKEQDVTCGIGFRIEGRANAPHFRALFYDPASGQPPTPEQLLADYDEAAKLARTGHTLADYAKVCHLRMQQDRVFTKMAQILRDEKLPSLHRFCPDSFGRLQEFPAAAQIFCMSFSYGQIPGIKEKKWPNGTWPTLRAYIRDAEWEKASGECHVARQSEPKNIGQKNLLLFAQKVKDEGLDPDTMPPRYY